MSDWITSGADAPLLRDTYYRDRRRRWRVAGASVIGAPVQALTQNSVAARDRGQYASTNPELKSWFDSLRSGKGPC
ncbi:MAG: hypothetical protein JWQ94_1802, partial [Tardiphaga sp.]|nr:hypothetical protein [Tardiphaga sp.]